MIILPNPLIKYIYNKIPIHYADKNSKTSETLNIKTYRHIYCDTTHRCPLNIGLWVSPPYIHI